MNKDIKDWVMQCSNCQLVKSKRHTKAPFVCYPIATEALSEINVDLMGHFLKVVVIDIFLLYAIASLKPVLRLHFRIQKVTQLLHIF